MSKINSISIAGAVSTGSWTPAIYDDLTAGNQGSLGTATGRYMKIGVMVMISAVMDTFDTTGMTAGNTLYIGGLPFNRQHSVGVPYNSSDLRCTYVTFSGVPVVNFGYGSSQQRLRLEASASGGLGATLLVSAFSDDQAGLYFSLIYEASS